jgi:hypothetical protein
MILCFHALLILIILKTNEWLPNGSALVFASHDLPPHEEATT